jgi:hypothetical protein
MDHKELIERISGGDGIGAEEILLLLATMGQGGQMTLDPNTALITGMLLGRAHHVGGGRGLDAGMLAAMLAMNANASAAAAQTGTGVPATPTGMNPLLLVALMGLGRERPRGGLVEIKEKDVA